jgi:hypothetical protein
MPAAVSPSLAVNTYSLAICGMDLPEERSSCTASALRTLVDIAVLPLAPKTPLRGSTVPNVRLSVMPGQVHRCLSIRSFFALKIFHEGWVAYG